MQKSAANWLASLCCLLVFTTPIPVTAKTAGQALTLTECFVPNIRSKAKCGRYDVPENRALPMSDDNKISLNIVVLPKFKEESTAYPLLFLAGGPGQAATELAPVINRRLNEIRQQHDIIFIDQRGTGKSSPLSCDDDSIDSLTYDDSTIDIKTDIKECLAQLTDKHLPSYNSYDSIRDFEAVRDALGVQKLHLLGGSYGTRAGFVYLKLFPESIETATLDSNAPMELVIGLFGKTSERAFDMLLSDCQADEACIEAFPNLKQDFLSLIANLEKGPIKESIYHPVTGQKVQAVLTKRKVLEALRTTLYDLDSRQVLPYMINKAANGDTRFLNAFIGRAADSERMPGGMYIGLTMNIVCNEDIPRGMPSDFEADAKNYFNGREGHSTFTDVCKYWPKWQAPLDFAEPATADLPVLLFSGSYDPVTPPAYGEMALQHLPNAKHVEIKYGSHVASIRNCTDLINQFLDEKSFEKLDFGCADEAIPMMFFTDMNQLR